MNKMTFAAAVICFSFSHASYSEEMSATGWYAASSAVVSWAVPHWLAELYSPPYCCRST